MSTSNTLTKTDLANILNEIVAIDGTDMTPQEIEDFIDSLNITSINAVDYIVEQGTSGIWTYRKWNSGRIEADAATTNSFAMTSTIGTNSYYGNVSFDISALGILSFKHIQLTGDASGGYMASKPESITTSSFMISARSSVSYTANVIHYIHIEGAWK